MCDFTLFPLELWLFSKRLLAASDLAYRLFENVRFRNGASLNRLNESVSQSQSRSYSRSQSRGFERAYVP